MCHGRALARRYDPAKSLAFAIAARKFLQTGEGAFMLRSVAGRFGRALMMLSGTLASAQVATAIEADAIAFGTRESVRKMGLSPDGKQAVFVGPGPGRTTIAYHVDIAAGATKPILKASGIRSGSMVRIRVRSAARVPLLCAWCKRRRAAAPLDPNDLAQHRRNGYQGARSARNRLRPGSQANGRRGHRLAPGNGDEILMSWLYVPQGPRAASLSTVRNKQGVGVVKVDTRTLRSSEVEPARRQVGSFLSDGRGNIRVQGISEETGDGQLTGRRKYQYRIAGSRDWRDLEPYQDGEFIPLAVDGDFDALYSLRRKDGRYALVRTALGATPLETFVASHPRVDIDDIVRSANGQKIIGYTHAEERREVTYFDPASKGLVDALGRALPKLSQIQLVDSSEDGSKVLIHAGADNDADAICSSTKPPRNSASSCRHGPSSSSAPWLRAEHYLYGQGWGRRSRLPDIAAGQGGRSRAADRLFSPTEVQPRGTNGASTGFRNFSRRKAMRDPIFAARRVMAITRRSRGWITA